MLSMDEIRTLKVNPNIVIEGIRQAEQRITDALETKKGYEAKAFPLLAGYITVTMAILGFILNLKAETPHYYHTEIMLGISGIIFFIGTIFLIMSLRSYSYGTIGRYPDTWLQPDTIDGDDNTLYVVLAYTLHDYQSRITTSDESNNKKSRMLNRGIYIGASAPLVPLILTIIYHSFLYFQN